MMVRIKILGSGIGVDKVELDGKDITQALTEIEVKISSSITEVKLTLLAEVDAELEANLLALEKAGYTRFGTLDHPRGRFVRIK
jgi:hypothetical protein